VNILQPHSKSWGWLPEINHSVGSGEIVCRSGELVIEWKNQSCGAAMPIVPAEQDWCTMLLAFEFEVDHQASMLDMLTGKVQTWTMDGTSTELVHE